MRAPDLEGIVMNLSGVHVVSLVLALSFALWLSIRAGKKVKSAEDYSVGGRSAGVSMVAGGLLGTAVGGAATVGTAQMAFDNGLVALWFTLGCTLGFIIQGLFYANRLLKTKLTTVPEFLVLNFGSNAGPVASIVASIGIFFSVVTSMITATHLNVFLFHLSIPVAMLFVILAALALIYFGGIGGSGLAGLFKMLLLFLAVGVAGINAFVDMGGLLGMQDAFAPGYLSLQFNNNIATLCGMVVGVLCTQTYVQVVFSASSKSKAVLGACLAGIACAPIGLSGALVGMFMKLKHPEIVSINALPLYLVNYLPPWLAGLGLAALILSVTGSIAGLALGISTMLSNDLYARFFKVTDSLKVLKANRLLMTMVLIGSAIFSYAQLNSLVLFWNYLSMGLRGAGIFVPFTLALFFPGKVRKGYGLVAMVIGTIIYFTSDLLFPWNNAIASSVLVTLMICLLGMVRYKQIV